MTRFTRPTGPTRAPAPFRIATGLLATLALFFTACGNNSSPINSPLSAGPSAAATKQARPGLAKTASSAAASNFTLLANAAVTATGANIIGDVGTFQAAPTGSVTLTSSPVTGTIHVGDATAVKAYRDFLIAYEALRPQPGDTYTQILTGTLSGVTLPPGVYLLDAVAKTGVLTLDGPSDGVWIFKVGTGALTGTNFSVVMAGGAQACSNVTWWVDQAVTMTDSYFIGTILAGAAITLTDGTFDGNAYSKADITVTGTGVTGCPGNIAVGNGNHGVGSICNQGVGNGPEGCDPGNSNNHNSSNDENGGIPGNPGRKGSK